MEAHARNVEKRATTLKKGRWSEIEQRLLAKAYIRILPVNPASVHEAARVLAAANVVERKPESIRKRIGSEAFLAILAEEREAAKRYEGNNRSNPSPNSEVEVLNDSAASSTTSRPSIREKFRTWAEAELVDRSSLGLAEERLLGTILEGDLDRMYRLIEEYIAATTIGQPSRPERAPPRPSTDGQPISKRAQRKKDYTHMQSLYHKDRKTASVSAITGSWRKRNGDTVSSDDKYSFWRKVFESPQKSDPRDDVAPTVLYEDLAAPIAYKEVTGQIQSLEKTAPGPDGETVWQFKTRKARSLHILYNAILYSCRTPSSFRVSRTTLIPKLPEPKGPGEFRPISVSNLLCRVYHKILAARINATVHLSEQQRAFREVDGTATNVVILNTILEDAKRCNSDLAIAFLDVRKAFDSVSHASIIRAAKRVGIPGQLTQYLSDYYANGSTEICGRTVGISNGVRQGDPLSPFLFNAIVDEALICARRLNLGYKMNGCSYSALGFADDLAILSASGKGLQMVVTSILDVLSKSGLKPNVAKCATLVIQADKRNKRWNCDPRPFLDINGTLVKALDVSETYRYLGILYGVTRTAQPVKGTLDSYLAHLGAAPLKPQQRLFILKTCAIPKLLHMLVLGTVGVVLLGKLDRAIRLWLRKVLHLPHDTPTAFFHAPVPVGGLGVPSLRTIIPVMKEARIAKICATEEEEVRNLTSTKTFELFKAKHTLSKSYFGTDLRSKDQIKTFWKDRLLSSCDGKGLSNISDTPHVNNWVEDGTRLMSGGQYIKALKVRGNLWPTATRNARGRPNLATETLCSAGCRVRDTAGHRSQSCVRTHDKTVERHNRLNTYIAGRLKEIGYQVLEEPTIPTVNGPRKPDIVCARSGVGFVLDTTVVADAVVCPNLLGPYMQKVKRYDLPEIRKFASEKFGVPSEAVQFEAVTLSWRGALAARSSQVLTKLGLGRRDQKILVVKSLEGTVFCLETYSKRTYLRRFRRSAPAATSGPRSQCNVSGNGTVR